MATRVRNTGVGFTRIIQQDLSAGMFPALAPELIPPNGAFDITNGLLNEQNVCYRRGGTTYFSTAPAGAGPRLLWTGFLKSGGLQTIQCVANNSYRVEPGGSLTKIALVSPTALTQGVAFQGRLYVPGSANNVWDGATASSDGRGGSSAYATAANRLIAGSGSRIAVSNIPKKEGEAVSWEETPVEPTITTTAKSVTATVSSAAGIKMGQRIVSEQGGVAGLTTITGISGTTITLSREATITAAGVPCIIGEANYLQLPEGVNVTSMTGWRNSVFVFTTQGIYVIGGLSHANITDENGNVQWTMDRYSADATLWGPAGVAAWKGGLVVPAKDDIWVVQFGVSSEKLAPFRSISGAIHNVYRAYVAAGYTPGAATVFNGHYILPVLNGEAVIDLLVCRLAGVNAAGRAEPAWTHLRGYGAELTALTPTVNDVEGPLIGSTAGAGRVLKLSYFMPSAQVENDANGAPISFELTTRSIPTGNLVRNLIGKARLSYRMNAPPGTKIELSIGSTPYATEWGAFNWGEANWANATGPFTSLGESIPPAKADPEGVVPKVWRVGKKIRFARMKITLNGPASQVSFRMLELFVREDGRVI
jgi:hypothetical protein